MVWKGLVFLMETVVDGFMDATVHSEEGEIAKCPITFTMSKSFPLPAFMDLQIVLYNST